MSELKIGDEVNYHPILNKDIGVKRGTITDIAREPNNFGCDVAWITGKAGCVGMEHLTKK